MGFICVAEKFSAMFFNIFIFSILLYSHSVTVYDSYCIFQGKKGSIYWAKYVSHQCILIISGVTKMGNHMCIVRTQIALSM